MKKISLIIFLFACMMQNNAVKAQLPAAISARLQTVLDSVCTKYKIKGATAAVLVPNNGIWKGTHGFSHENVPITSDMLMGMGSNTKTFISCLLLKMQENSLLSLNDSIGKWIQGYANINGQVTIRQLLNHTSGIADYLHNDAVNDSIDSKPGKIWTSDELLRMALTPRFAPGADWEYSNTNYILAGVIIQAVLNKSPEVAMKEMILTPHGLNNTMFYGEQTTQTLPHQWSMNITGTSMTDLNTMTPSLLNNLFSMASTAGAMITTAEDNVLFWHKLTSGQILSAASWNEMTQFVSIGSGHGYGLGIFFYNKILNGRSFHSHGGTFFGFINDNLADTTTGVCISVLTNQDSIDNNRILGSVIGALHKVTVQMPITGMNEAVYNSKLFNIFPNPANDVINITSANLPQHATLNLYDLSGRLQLSSELGSAPVPVTQLDAGLYIARITDQQGNVMHIQKIRVNR